ncbi:vitamin B6 photo-protection and homoeostasis-domain-containing protein [Microdochium trichocladiopsis]|uniref:Vitamin B6 photo-protection and homoeostasis-domain-containing protein n=1 Tax=Microdochium trichocladiopsis TaxID=1682393 RepID=A0A9P8YGZ2_9PEZI|nr:vitamin B6 photo-protection and homoeostasis-domain-containing protein [Microdochium trichocladiopsis]KAH7040204.1 vitamin B6 photo-protection and homoeostasis-domain-containing protein [Microdochium trichocladiopsis]
MGQQKLGDNMSDKSFSPRLVSAVDEAGSVLCVYDKDKASATGTWQAVIPKQTAKSVARAVLDVFLPAGYPHTVTPDYTPYQVYDSLQAFSSTIAGLLSSRAALQGLGVGDEGSSATAAVLLTVLQESIGRISTIVFAHRLGQAIEPECKYFRFLADILNDAALIIKVFSPALPHYAKVFSLCATGTLHALCGVAAGASKASLSAHFAKNGNLAELNAKDGSQETVISLLGMLAGSLFIRVVTTPTAVWTSMLLLVGLHLWTNYQAVRSVQMRSLNRQRATIVTKEFFRSGIVPSPAKVARREHILSWKLAGPPIEYARTFPQSGEVSVEDLKRHGADRYVLARQQSGLKIFLKENASPLDALKGWVAALVGPADMAILDKEGFWEKLTLAGWDTRIAALETGPAIRIRIE